MQSQLRRAALSVHLNIAEGASRKSLSERKRYEIARGSLVEVDAALDIAQNLGYLNEINLNALEYLMIKCFKILSGLIKSTIHH